MYVKYNIIISFEQEKQLSLCVFIFWQFLLKRIKLYSDVCHDDKRVSSKSWKYLFLQSIISLTGTLTGN